MAQTKAPPEKKTDWVTPTAVVLGVGGLSVGLYLYLRKKPVKRTFNISKPIPSPHDASLGQIVTITCGISMTEGSALNGIAVLQVFEGSILSGHGSPLGQVSKPLQISTGESKTVTFSYTAIGAIGRKDVAIVIYDGDTEVGSNEWDDLFYTIESGVSFALARPSALPNPASPGSTVTITCPITSNSSEVKSVTANIKIYEGSILAAHGTLLSTKIVSFSISPGQTYNGVVTDIAVAGSIDRRDIGVEVYVGGQLITSDEWDDVFYVQSGGSTSFSLGQPSALPNPASPGSTVTITCPITSNSSEVKSVTANIKIYEGSILAAHGTLLSTKIVSFSISPGQTYNGVVTDIAVAGSIDRRDIGVEVYVGGQLITSDEWDDVFYVQSGGGVAVISASFNNAVVSYSFSGFQPNAAVRLTVVERGGYLIVTADSSGSGSGSFIDSDNSGTYTLLATDDYGHTASCQFVIPLYNFSVVLINAGIAFPGATHWWAYYYDPITESFVSSGQYFPITQQINFNSVHNFGWLAVFLYNSSTGLESSQISSPPIPLVANNMSLIFNAATGEITSL